MKTHTFLFALAVAVSLSDALAGTPARSGQESHPPNHPAVAAGPQKSLYERLGGVYPISVVVDDFIERLFVNDTLNANPAIREARERVPKQGLKFHVTTLVCQATGGPCQYTGRDMKSSHVHLNISEKEWQGMLSDFRKALDKFDVPALEQGELVTIVNSTKTDIVAGVKTASE
jgi:hemoglobin